MGNCHICGIRHMNPLDSGCTRKRDKGSQLMSRYVWYHITVLSISCLILGLCLGFMIK